MWGKVVLRIGILYPLLLYVLFGTGWSSNCRSTRVTVTIYTGWVAPLRQREIVV
jgi:hypothetical protein